MWQPWMGTKSQRNRLLGRQHLRRGQTCAKEQSESLAGKQAQVGSEQGIAPTDGGTKLYSKLFLAQTQWSRSTDGWKLRLCCELGVPLHSLHLKVRCRPWYQPVLQWCLVSKFLSLPRLVRVFQILVRAHREEHRTCSKAWRRASRKA